MDGELREKVARMVEPMAWEIADLNPAMSESERKIFRSMTPARLRDQSLAKANAILSSLQGEAQPVAWWCAKPEGTGFPVRDHPGEWPNMTVSGLFLHPSPEQAGEVERLRGAAYTVDDLAQEIRRVDGNHDKGAGALAEALLLFINAHRALPTTPSDQGGAQPVAQTASITCAHEPYQGSCAHCGIRFVNGRPHPAPEQAGEVERLTKCLGIANANHEKFEREWYLACARAEAAEQALSDLKAEQALDRECLQLANTALACVTAFEDDARYIMGNSNFSIVQANRDAIRARLSKGEGE